LPAHFLGRTQITLPLAGELGCLDVSANLTSCLGVCPFLTLGFGKRANLADAFSYQKLFVNASLAAAPTKLNNVTQQEH
jgi:hypothetical protein